MEYLWDKLPLNGERLRRFRVKVGQRRQKRRLIKHYKGLEKEAGREAKYKREFAKLERELAQSEREQALLERRQRLAETQQKIRAARPPSRLKATLARVGEGVGSFAPTPQAPIPRRPQRAPAASVAPMPDVGMHGTNMLDISMPNVPGLNSGAPLSRRRKRKGERDFLADLIG